MRSPLAIFVVLRDNIAACAARVRVLASQGEAQTPYPSLFFPILVHGSTSVNQTLAIMSYLGELYGLYPSGGALDTAHAIQVSNYVFDCLSEAEHAYHPTSRHASYSSQHEAAQETVEAFAKERLPKYLGAIEKCLGMSASGFAVGDKLTYADIILFQFVRGYRSSMKAHFASNESIPLLKEHTARIEADERVAAFLVSDKCTKMEQGEPLAPPDSGRVQTNSFM